MKTPEPLRIRHLSVGVLGGIQPDKLSTIIDGPDDGLASRLLWAWPEAPPGFSLCRSIVEDTEAQTAFARLTALPMGSDEFGNPEPKRVRLMTTAENVLEAYACDIGIRAADASGIFAGALGKARGHVLRLALVLEYLWWCTAPEACEPSIISERAVIAAAGLVDGYFIPMAERVLGDAAIPASERNAMTLARYLRKSKLAEFNARDVRREVGGNLREGRIMDAACLALVEAALIRPVRGQAIGPGRKPKNFEVNMAVWKVAS